MEPRAERPAVLVAAGLDPTGRAGLAADLRALAALDVHGAPLATCLTDQASAGPAAVVGVDAALFARQLARVLDDVDVRAVKVGLVASAEVARALAAALAGRPALPVVVDPVLATSGGASLVDAEVRAAMVRELVGRAHVLTPNLDEADLMLGRPAGAASDAPLEAARALLALGPRAVLLKGGHGAGEFAVDLWLDAEGPRELALPRLAGHAARGTGCALAAALAAHLARGTDPATAAWEAKRFVHAALARSSGDGARGVLAVAPD